MSLEDEMLKKMLADDAPPTIEEQVEEAEAKAEQGQNLYWRDMGSALYDWAKGAIAGAEEVGRAATNLGANVPADYLDEQALETPELTPEQQQAEDWYQKAIDKYNEETTQPLMVAAALSGIPGVSTVGAMGMLPMMVKQLQTNVEKEGIVSGTVSTGLDMVPFLGSYRMTQDPNFQQFAEARPARAAGLLVMNEAGWLASGIQLAKLVDRKALIKKFNGNMEKVLEFERKLKAQKDLEKAKVGEKTVKEKSVSEAAAKDTEVKMAREEGSPIPKDKEFKFEKPRNSEEEVNMARNPKVSKDIDDAVYEQKLAKQRDDFEANRVHKGAYDVEVEAAPPTDLNLGRVTVLKIWDTANEIVPARIGNLVTRSKKVLGHFRPIQEIVNVRDTLDLPVLAHEVGHYIDTVLNITGFDKELIDAAKSKWKSGYKEHEWRGEGIAEFTTEYVLNPEVAKQNFPGYYEAFTKAITEHPELASKFEQLCQEVRTWKHMSPEERVRGNMVFDGDVKKGLVQRVKETFDNIRNSWLDDNYTLKNIGEDFFDTVGISLLNSENPFLVATAIKNWIPARGTMLNGFFSDLSDKVAIGSLRELYGVPLHEITLGTIYNKLRDLNVDKKIHKYYTDRKFSNIHEAFSAYALAVHALDVIPVKNAERIAAKTEKLTGYMKQLEKLKPVETLSKEIQQLMSDISNPENAAKLPELRQKVAEKTELKKAYEKQTVSQKTIKKIEQLEKKIQQTEMEIDAIKNGLDDYRTFADKPDLQAMVDNAPPEFKALIDDLSKVSDNYLMLAARFGFVDAAEYATLRKQYPHYVPMHRDFSLDGFKVNPGGSGRSGSSGFVDVMSPIRALKEQGSTRTVVDPISELYKSTQALIDAGERNILGQQFAKLADMDKAGRILVKTGERASSSAKGTFAVWKDGKQTYYQAIAPGLYEAITGNSHAAAKYAKDVIESVLTKGANCLRIGATSTPMFMLWNGFRDTFTAAFYSQTGLAPIKGTIDGFMLRADEQLMAKFMAQGVPFSTFIGSNKDIMKMFLSKTKVPTGKDKAFSILKKPFEFFEHVNEATEQAPRLAEFKRVYDRAIKAGKPESEALFLAGQAARELTVNFSKMGTNVRRYNRYAAFLNAAIQGNAKIVEAFGADLARTVRILNGIREGKISPKGEAQKTWNAWKNGDINAIEAIRKVPMGTTIGGLLEISLPCMFLWAMNHDKDWYKDLSYEEKMRNCFVEITDGVIIRLPKPELLGYILGSVPERMLDYAYDNDPQALLASSAGEFLLESLVPQILPTAILPAYEWRGNINFFRNRPIEDAKAQKVEVEDRYNIYTSEMAKYAGKTLGLSPMKIDNAFRDVTGSLGSFFLGVMDMALKDKKLPARDWRDLTRITYNPTSNSKNRTAEVFYADSEKAEQKFNSEVLKGLKKPNQKPKNLKIYDKAKKDLKPLYQEQSKITNGVGKYEKMTPEERGKKRVEIREMINDIQRKANNRAGYRYVPVRKK